MCVCMCIGLGAVLVCVLCNYPWNVRAVHMVIVSPFLYMVWVEN